MLGGDLGLAAGELRELTEYLAHTGFPEIALAQGIGGARLSLGRAVAGRGGGASAERGLDVGALKPTDARTRCVTASETTSGR